MMKYKDKPLFDLVARRQVVLDIIDGKQKTEERDYNDYYINKFETLTLPCFFKLRAGYKKETDQVIVEVLDFEYIDYYTEDTDELEYSTILFHLGKVMEFKKI